jgi:hypothetical protein
LGFKIDDFHFTGLGTDGYQCFVVVESNRCRLSTPNSVAKCFLLRIELPYNSVAIHANGGDSFAVACKCNILGLSFVCFKRQEFLEVNSIKYTDVTFGIRERG